MGEGLTLSGSSALTLRPGLARSGKTHSFEGLANNLPAEEEVSLLPLATAFVEVTVDVNAVLGREAIGGREGIAIFTSAVFPLLCIGRDREVEAALEGREVILEDIDAFNGRGTATDMTRSVVDV
jgi:hypothetical protein